MFQMPAIAVSAGVAKVINMAAAIGTGASFFPPFLNLFFLPFLYPFFDPTNPGASVAGTAAGWAGMPHNVTFKLELENYTNVHLKVFAIFFLGV